MKKRILSALLAALTVLTGCQRAPEPAEGSTFAMDTVINYTVYAKSQAKAREVQDRMTEQLSQLESLLSVTGEDSDITQVNQGAGAPVEVDGRTARLLDRALELCAATGGALDVTAYPAVKAWGFTTGDYRVPGEAELAELVSKIDYAAVRLTKNTVTLPAGVEIDLGAAAKGYAGDLLAGTARQAGVASALLNLGQSTIVAIGSKPGGEPWRIGVQDPEGEGILGVVELEDQAMGTSGGYQRFFEENGVTYWHILDPDTAAPARSGLTSVTVVAPSALTCDGLSTALFVMGLEEGTRFWRERRDFEVLFVTEEGGVFCTAGLAERFSLAYQDREVTVLE